MIHWELCKRLMFDDTEKWYMHKPESVLENETQKDFEMQTDYSIMATRPRKKKKKLEELELRGRIETV